MPFQQDLTGLIEPTAKTWADATPEQRLWYYGQMAKLAERRKRVELMQAIGRGPGGQSVVMAPRKHPRSDGASGPVMDPHGGASRAFQLLASSATANSCKLYWRAGGAIVSKSGTVYFTDVLGFHAAGQVRGAPVRDVRLSDDSIAALRREGESIWRKRPKQSGAKPPKTSATQPTKVSTKGPTQQGGNPFKTILPPKTPKVSQAKAASDAKKAAEAARVAEAAKRKAEAEARAAADRARLEAAAEAARKKAEAEAKARAEAAAKVAAAKAKALAEARAAEAARKVAEAKAKAEAEARAAAAAAREKARLEAERRDHEARLAALARAKAEAAKPKPAATAPAWTPRKQSEFEAIGSAKGMETFGRESFGAWADNLSQQDKNAIKLYAADNYKWMNAILRGRDPATIDLPGGLSAQGARDYIARAIAPLARGKVDRDVVAYRGVRSLTEMGIDPSKLVQGQDLEVKGFFSATLKQDKANDFAVGNVGIGPENFADDGSRAILQVNTPKGSTGAYLNAAELSGYSDERELLMPPGAKLKFVRQGGTHKDIWGHETPILVFERVE